MQIQKICCVVKCPNLRAPSQARCREHWNEYCRDYRQKNRKKLLEYHRWHQSIRYHTNQRERIQHRAHHEVEVAKKSGRLVCLPCEVCGEKKTHAHHDSYKTKNFLVVRFLCKDHHAEWHRNNEPTY